MYEKLTKCPNFTCFMGATEIARQENAGLENDGQSCRGGKCRTGK